MLQALGDRHVAKGFLQATERMKEYNPAEHDATSNVAPLVQFFELVHVGDTIQSMVQVYFDKELAPHIDKTDFLNAVVREKKRFENTLDDSVALGLNAGTDVLMNQVEHIILTLTKARVYYPPEDAPLELGPTKGCIEAITCLESHSIPQVAASSIPQVLFYNPLSYASSVKSPILVMICGADIECSPVRAKLAAERAPQGESHTLVGASHEGLYAGKKFFGEASEKELEFLKRVVPV
ncbi:hypothetical protein NLJ89_g11318 [Agrocybe chaxingu]|uniref:Exocyst complex component Sec10-like alpha-helical bundle domain-containing protein n=1 Tax=Agrocybe chaxingu TaxID=84603 RepID=A0A9W8JM46_9AGAR|nr:hypothetical protein NLJ89_g11318 [Agrocybe chaxingu]